MSIQVNLHGVHVAMECSFPLRAAAAIYGFSTTYQKSCYVVIPYYPLIGNWGVDVVDLRKSTISCYIVRPVFQPKKKSPTDFFGLAASHTITSSRVHANHHVHNAENVGY